GERGRDTRLDGKGEDDRCGGTGTENGHEGLRYNEQGDRNYPVSSGDDHAEDLRLRYASPQPASPRGQSAGIRAMPLRRLAPTLCRPASDQSEVVPPNVAGEGRRPLGPGARLVKAAEFLQDPASMAGRGFPSPAHRAARSNQPSCRSSMKTAGWIMSQTDGSDLLRS